MSRDFALTSVEVIIEVVACANSAKNRGAVFSCKSTSHEIGAAAMVGNEDFEGDRMVAKTCMLVLGWRTPIPDLLRRAFTMGSFAMPAYIEVAVSLDHKLTW